MMHFCPQKFIFGRAPGVPVGPWATARARPALCLPPAAGLAPQDRATVTWTWPAACYLLSRSLLARLTGALHRSTDTGRTHRSTDACGPSKSDRLQVGLQTVPVPEIRADDHRVRRRLAAAAPGLGPWSLQGPSQPPPPGCRAGTRYYASRKITDKKGCQPNR